MSQIQKMLRARFHPDPISPVEANKIMPVSQIQNMLQARFHPDTISPVEANKIMKLAFPLLKPNA